ncbi:MAG: zinc ribbon domain-containing protein [Clostridia bacterium]|nr:zinc ribbon domain-containing protein [Clostridia bacterium]
MGMRYHNEFKFNHPIHEQLFADIHQYMLNEGYEYRNFEGENVYKKGKGFNMGPTFLKIMADQNHIVVEAWIKFAILPGVYAGETGIDGLFGAVPKGMLAGRVHTVETMIINNGGIATGATSAAPGGNPQPQQPVYNQPPVQPQQPPVQPQQPPVQPQQPPVQPQQPPVQPQQPPVQPQKDHIFCSRCGNKMPISASFCTNCGNKLK